MNPRRIVSAVSALLLLLIVVSFGPAFAENLLENADFTELDDDGIPTGWYTDAYIQEAGYTRFQVTAGDAEHPRALLIQNIGENDARLAQTVDVEPESMYLFSGYIRAEGVEEGHGANLSVEGIYAFSEPVYDTDGLWQYVEYYGETGPDQDYVTVFARLGGYSGESTGKAYFSGLSFTKVDHIPGDTVADLWYRERDDSYDDEGYDPDEDSSSGSSVFLLFLIISVYTAAAACMIFRERFLQRDDLRERKTPSVTVGLVLLLSLALRLMISWLVEGYMVDVNCFLSWGHTMASSGPARFYEATNFCDYPPLYTYILALNSVVSQALGNSVQVSRVVFRFIPSVCDLLSCWMLYRIVLRREGMNARVCFIFLVFAAFNPATVLNSAAWGQMDGVLCMLLLAVSLYAVSGKWKAALPLYVVAVLVKPQALMLGPLGLFYIIFTFIRNRESRKSILQGVAFSLLVLAAGLIPFSIRQNWDWLIQLYGRTLASYPYATVNTANFYYLLGGNWSAVDKGTHLLAPVILSVCSAGYGCWWYFRSGKMNGRLIETAVSGVFSAAFLLFACLNVSWAWNGGLAMVFAFFIVLSHAVRSGTVRWLPWLGALLYILLYVFGVKMHERYVFPALLLLCGAWALLRDRRILYVLLLFTFTVFLNEGIVLDNSIRLGSSFGHLNSDTVWLADILSVLNVAGSLYAVWLSIEMLDPREKKAPAAVFRKAERKWDCDRKLHWNRKDTLFVVLITTAYSLVALLTLGSTKAPQTCWTSSSAEEQVIFDLGREEDSFEILYFAQVSRNDFSVSVSTDGVNWEEETWAQMKQGQCWKWKYVTVSYEDEDGERTYYDGDESYIERFSGRYVRLSAHQLGLRLNEVLFRDAEGGIIPANIAERRGTEPDSELYSDPAALLDEQDSIEALPSVLSSEEASSKIQPSWWNSTYFDEIYHARTAYEFLKGTTPYETSHPPLGKILMTLSVALFGMTPFGWRFAGAVAGILMLPGMYLLGKQLTKKTYVGVLACLCMALDCMHLTQSQIATIDSFPVLFIIFAYFFMLRFLQTDFVREKTSVSLASLGFSGLFMGLAIASKWIGIYAGAGLAVLFFWHCARMIRLRRDPVGTDADPNGPDSGPSGQRDTASGRPVQPAVRRMIVLCAWCVLFFVIVPAAIYLLSYLPYFAYKAGRIHSLWEYIAEVWQAQVGMFNYHSTPNLGMDHPFYSPWWEWPLIGKPMYYASQQYIEPDSAVHHSIFCFGNPVIWFGGLAALAFTAFRLLHDRRNRTADGRVAWRLGSESCDPRYVFIAVGLLAQYLPWVLVPRGTYIYHYFASLPFLMAAVCLCFDGWKNGKQRYAGIAAILFMTAAAVFFILLFPYASGMNVSSEWLDIGRGILKIWY